MRVMAFASQKGGSGKTTLAGHIAVQAERAGAESRTNMVGAADTLADETTRPRLRNNPAPARSTLADWVAPDPAPSTTGAKTRYGKPKSEGRNGPPRSR